MTTFFYRQLNPYKIAVFISSLSMSFGILRELLIVSLFGFTIHNDKLQLYLSVFYTIGLTLDAMRLTCLNLYTSVSLLHIIISASIVSLPFSIGVGLILNYFTSGMDITLLWVAIIGSYLNLITTLLITYAQRCNIFLRAQLINIMPNFILIPGVIICCWINQENATSYIVSLMSIIPIIQCTFLLFLIKSLALTQQKLRSSLFANIVVAIRHFSAMIGEQLFQIITRASFFKYGPGYLSMFAILIRIYSASKFILVDSFIGLKLSNWSKKLQKTDTVLHKMINSNLRNLFILIISLLISFKLNTALIYSAIRMAIILMFGFYLSTLVRVTYFKINHFESNTMLVIRFAIYELLCATSSLLISKQFSNQIFILLWLGYVAKPFAQLFFLRKRLTSISHQIMTPAT